MPRPRMLYGVAVALMAILVTLADAEPPKVDPAQAHRYEGQRVLLAGLAADVRPSTDGVVRFSVIEGRDAVPVRLDGAAPNTGAWVEVEGSLVRLGGRLTLLANIMRATATHPEPAAPTWQELAAAPDDWRGLLIRLDGRIERGTLAGSGHSVALGDGAWPSSGPVEAVGSIQPDDRCLCMRFHAIEVAVPLP